MDKMLLTGLLGYIALLAKRIPGQIFSFMQKNISYSISIKNTDHNAYEKINQWLLKLNKKCIKGNTNIIENYQEGLISPVATVNYGNYMFTYNKSIVIVDKYMTNSQYSTNDIVKVIIFGINAKKNYDALKKHCNGSSQNGLIIKQNKNEYEMSYFMTQNKKIEDVFCKDKYKILDYVKKWIGNRDFYFEHGIIYKTGILLYGDPGTGKTTMARALATHLNCSISIIDLKKKASEGLIMELVNKNNDELKIILLEDIDCICSNREEELSSENKEFIGFLLNLLDGVSSPQNTIFIATTNHIDKLDKAIIRKGRFDFQVEMGNVDRVIAKEMCDRFNVDYSILDGETFPINPSHLQSKILKKIEL